MSKPILNRGNDMKLHNLLHNLMPATPTLQTSLANMPLATTPLATTPTTGKKRKTTLRGSPQYERSPDAREMESTLRALER